MRFPGYLILLLGFIISVTLAGCEDSKESVLQAAQICLDKATPSTAMACYGMVAGDSSQKASVIRCSAILIHEEVSSSGVLENVANSLKGNTASALSAMSFIAFKASGRIRSDSTDLAKANLATVDCKLSGSKGLSMLSSLASIATAMNAHIIPFNSPITPSNVSTILSALPQAPALLQTSYEQNCLGSISSTNELYCSQYSDALKATGGASPAAAADHFLLHLK